MTLAFHRATFGWLSAFVAVLAVGACDDDPFGLEDWVANPTELLVYSLARPELNLPSGANLYQKFTVRIEQPTSTGNWDIALDTREGQLVFLMPPALGVQGSSARITSLPGMSFDEVVRAPADSTVYLQDEAMPVSLNTVYVVRTNQYPGPFGQRCFFYSKLEPLEFSVETGTVRFLVDTNPRCNDRGLVPPSD